MSGWVKVKEGVVTLEHYSTSSLIKLTIDSESGPIESWFDYAEYDDLQKCMAKIAEILNH